MQISHCALRGADRPCAPKDCARCKGEQSLHRHGSYRRYADCSGSSKVTVARFICPRCRTTFGVIPAGMFPYRSIPVTHFERWMDARFDDCATARKDSARPPPTPEVERGCLLRAMSRLQSRIPLLCGLLDQRMPVLHGSDIRGFWRALRVIGRLEGILAFLAGTFKTSLLADYLSLRPHWQRKEPPVGREPAPA